jgi:two-component system response regulator HupR/HoxA
LLCASRDSIANGSKPRIAIVDDDALILESFADEFSEEFQILRFLSPLEALDPSILQQLDVIIADYRMPVLDGITFLTKVQQSRKNLTRILFTAYADLHCLTQAINEAAIFHYIAKDSLGRPGKHSEIANIIRGGADLTKLHEERAELLRRLTKQTESLREENEKLSQQRPRSLDAQCFSDLIGNSLGLQQVIRRGIEAAKSDHPVLIHGETGTGKEILSRAIHFEGARRNRPFVAIDCSAAQKELITADLMGYTKGAFTSASDNKRGVLEVADKGTVFLDEIGDMPLESQAHLLRFLESKEVRPLGSATTRRVDVRIIAATHCDLENAVEARTFRQDLYYRLTSGIELTLPPLRERMDDLPVLIDHIVGNEDKRHAVHGAAPETLELLKGHPFRGNIRELIGIIRKALTEAVLSGDNLLLPSHFYMLRSNDTTPSAADHWKTVANRAKIEEIKRALSKHKTITAAAAELRLSREGLSRMMSSLGITNPREK